MQIDDNINVILRKNNRWNGIKVNKISQKSIIRQTAQQQLK